MSPSLLDIINMSVADVSPAHHTPSLAPDVSPTHHTPSLADLVREHTVARRVKETQPQTSIPEDNMRTKRNEILPLFKEHLVGGRDVLLSADEGRGQEVSLAHLMARSSSGGRERVPRYVPQPRTSDDEPLSLSDHLMQLQCKESQDNSMLSSKSIPLHKDSSTSSSSDKVTSGDTVMSSCGGVVGVERGPSLCDIISASTKVSLSPAKTDSVTASQPTSLSDLLSRHSGPQTSSRSSNAAPCTASITSDTMSVSQASPEAVTRPSLVDLIARHSDSSSSSSPHVNTSSASSQPSLADLIAQQSRGLPGGNVYDHGQSSYESSAPFSEHYSRSSQDNLLQKPFSNVASYNQTTPTQATPNRTMPSRALLILAEQSLAKLALVESETAMPKSDMGTRPLSIAPLGVAPVSGCALTLGRKTHRRFQSFQNLGAKKARISGKLARIYFSRNRFDFSTPSPDEVVASKQTKGFNRK